MSLNVNQLVKNIKEGKEVEVYLPQYFNRSLSSYYKYSCVNMTMKYVMLYEVLSEKHNNQVDHIKDILLRVNTLIRETVVESFDESLREQKVAEIDEVRKQIILEMKSITAYADIMQLYEYVLNRIEDKYADELQQFEETAFANTIISYIFDTKDNVTINTKVQEMVGQLPIRMAKGKYFDLLNNSLSVYKGGERASLDGFVYMIKSAAALERPKEMKKFFPEMAKAVATLEKADLKNLTKPEFYRLNGMILDRSMELIEISDLFMQLQEIVNSLYAYNLSVGYETADFKEEGTCKELLSYINELFLAGGTKEADEDKLNELTKLEGLLERSVQEIGSNEGNFESVMSMYGKKLKDYMLDKQGACVMTCMKLLGNSMFIELNAKVSTKLVDDAYIEKVSTSLIKNLTKLFEKSSQNIIRAVMAGTLSKMPVFFNNSDEIMSYISNSLHQCKDEAEKSATYSIIMDIIHEQ